LNTGEPTKDQKERMKEEGKKLVKPDVDEIEKLGTRVYLEDLINKKEIYVKHDPYKLRDLIFKIAKDYGII
jgi:ElaB/YqjD/DUF883 family membrane-anchored ribosome-binding protein